LKNFLRKIFSLIFILCLLTISSCKPAVYLSEPNDLPENAMQTEIAQATTYTHSIFQQTEWVPEEWWLLFEDKQLNTFIQLALQNNPTLQTAKIRIATAQYQAANAHSYLYPTINLAGDVQRLKFSQTSLGTATSSTASPTDDASSTNISTPPPVTPVTGASSSIPTYATQYETYFNFLYEIDLWDKKKNIFQAALGKKQAKIADEAFIRLALSISLAQIYLDLQIQFHRLKLAKEIVKNREEYLRLIQQRIEHGIDTALNTQVAIDRLSSAKQVLFDLEESISTLKHQIQAYVGGFFDLNIIESEITNKLLPKAPLPQNIPLRLIAHRPDIISQLWLIEAAEYQVEVARAGFLPDLNLMAVAGFQTLQLQDLLEGRSTFGVIEPAFSLPIFNGGRTQAILQEQEANYNLAISEYNQLIIRVVQEVLDAISKVIYSYQQWEEFKVDAQAQENLSTLIDQKMQYGLGNKLEWLLSRDNALLARDKEATALNKSLQAILNLIRTLGGGYDVYK
jgi:NodT family efflux transporter outer membrane factor (OMF) lipoprotein